MKAAWPWFWAVVAVVLCACSGPEEGARRGDPASFVSGSDAGTGTQGDECASCDENAECAGTGEARECVCNDGYEGDGSDCANIDECAESTDDCDDNEVCADRPGTYDCTCKDGYVRDEDEDECTPVDECEGATNTCDPDATCIDEDPGFSCRCDEGFEGVDEGGFGCCDINECDDPELFSCAANARCVNERGGYDCECAPGYVGDGNEKCISLCDMGEGSPSCAEEGLCRLLGREAECSACLPGFSGDGTSCAPADCDADCDGEGADAEHAVCEADGSCACAPGYEGSPGGCSDRDECAEDPSICGEGAVCTNTEGGYTCACAPGYVRSDDGACVDRNECEDGSHLCHADAECTNTTPEESERGYECECREGFEGDGCACVDVNECDTDNGGCPEDSECVNTRGGFECRCPEPLVGEPGSCHCDLSGMWAMRQDVDTCWAERQVQEGLAQTLIAEGHMEATVWELYQIEYDGTQMTTRRKSCNNDNTPDLVSPLFRETYSSYIPLGSLDGLDLGPERFVDAAGLKPGSELTTPSEAGLLGIDLGDDPVNAPWPASHEDVPDSAWVDSDGDGEPGVSLWSRVPSEKTDAAKRSGGESTYDYLPVRPGVGPDGSFAIEERVACLSIAARVVTHLEGLVESCKSITGDVINESSHGRVHSCALVDKGTCDDETNTCTGWQEDVTCTEADWQNATRCDAEDLELLDNDQNQEQNSVTSFELVWIGELDDEVTCDTVRSELPEIDRSGDPTIKCTSPE